MKYIKLFENFKKENFKLLFKVNSDIISLADVIEITTTLFENNYDGYRETYTYYDKKYNDHNFKISVWWDNETYNKSDDIVAVKVFMISGDEEVLKEGLSKDISGKYYYDYELSTNVNLTFMETVNELNHQTPDVLGVNQIGFGQGAHVGNWGADYGNPSKGVRGHFGEKGDKTSPNLPQKSKQADFPSVIYDPTTNKMLMEDEIQDLILTYQTKVRQNNETPIEFNNIDSKTIEFIQNYNNNN